MLTMIPVTRATAATATATPTLSAKAIEVDICSVSGVSMNMPTIAAAPQRATSTSPTVSNTKFRRRVKDDAPNTLHVFIVFMRTGMSAKKKFTKFMSAMAIMSTAMARSVYVVALLPVACAAATTSVEK